MEVWPAAGIEIRRPAGDVDGDARVQPKEDIIAQRGGYPSETGNLVDTIAVKESPVPDGRHTLRDDQLPDNAAVLERLAAYIDNPLTEADGSEPEAAIESRRPDVGDRVGNGDGGETCAVIESRAPDGGDGIGGSSVINGTVNYKGTCWLGIVIPRVGVTIIIRVCHFYTAWDDVVVEGVSAGGDGGKIVGVDGACGYEEKEGEGG